MGARCGEDGVCGACGVFDDDDFPCEGAIVVAFPPELGFAGLKIKVPYGF